MRGLNSLYTRLAAGLVLLLLIIGVLYFTLNNIATQRYVAQLNQDLHRNLAQNLVADKNLVEQGRMNEMALKQTFQQYMVVNPSIEIYLLDLNGKLLSYSADPESVMRSSVSLQPIKDFLSGAQKYPLGDDPRSHDKQKAFSVTPVPSSAQPEGYLYVVLRGEQYDTLESMAFQGFLSRAGLWSMILSLALGLLAGLTIFYWLTQRLRKVSKQMQTFTDSDFSQWQSSNERGVAKDEIAQIEQTFSKMAGRIQQQLSALTDKDKQRRQLVAQVSHDLRTPLASMLGYVESLKLKRDELPEQEQQAFLDIVHKQGLRLSAMIDSLFELSSLEAKETRAHIEPFVPLEMLYDIQQKHLIRARKAEVDITIADAQSSGFALGDLSMLERVLDNLIDNAIVHARPNSEIQLAVTEIDQYIQISVQNQGEQIKLPDINAIFEPFFRANASDADKRHAGLGLAISKHIMKNMQGKITVENIHHGVVFKLRLPVYHLEVPRESL